MGIATKSVTAVVVFATTNIDDIILLSMLFADATLRPVSVVTGQFVGIGVLVAISALAAIASVVIPAGWTSLLGAVPLLLGLHKALHLIASRTQGHVESDGPRRSPLRGRSQILAVMGVTIANGGDNLGVYIPLFAADRRAILFYVPVFAVMTALWCALGFKLVTNEAFGAKLRRYGHVILPFVLIALGLHILSGGLVFLR